MAANTTPGGRLGAQTPTRRAISAEPASGRRSIHTPGTTRSQRQGGLSASGRKINAATTPHGLEAIRTLDVRRAAVLTPHRNRRRSAREQRETPRDLLRNLSRALKHDSRLIASSSSPGAQQRSELSVPSILEEEEEEDDDDLPIDRPRLSLPIDEDDDDSDLVPPRSAGLEDENYTVQSVELPRRALSEQPRRSSIASAIRMSDYGFGRADRLSDGVGIDSGFFPPMAPLDESGEVGLQGGDITYERLDSELGQRAAGRESDFGVIDVPFAGNDSTVVLAPLIQESPQRQPIEVGEPPGVDSFPDPVNDVDDEDDDVELEEAAVVKTAAHKGRRKKRGVKLSRHGIEYPSLPPGVVKRLAQIFAQTSGAKAKINPETLSAIMQASDWFFEQVGDDLAAYAKHAGRKTIDESDMITLMKRQRQTSSSTTPFALANRHLPRELLQELRMTPPVASKRRRKANVDEEE